MKKTLLVLVTVITSSTCIQAQISKGSVLVGGDLAASTQKTKLADGTTTTKGSGVTIIPSVGVAIRENLVVGINGGYSRSKVESVLNGSLTDYQSYGGGAFIRKYKTLGSGFYFFVQGSLGVWLTKQETRSDLSASYKSKGTSFQLNAYPGVSYAVCKRLQLETGLNNLLSLNLDSRKEYTGTGSSYTYSDKVTNFNVATSIGNSTNPFYLGMRLLLGKMKK